MKKIIASVTAATSLLSLLLPSFTFADTIRNIDNIAEKGQNIGALIIGICISLSVVWIIINVVRYLIAGDNSEKRKAGGYAVLFGVIGLFVILSIWGLVNILRQSFVTDPGSTIQDISNPGRYLPSLPPDSSSGTFNPGATGNAGYHF